MSRWNVYALLSEEVEADDEFEAERKGMEILERHGIHAQEICDEQEPESEGKQ